VKAECDGRMRGREIGEIPFLLFWEKCEIGKLQKILRNISGFSMRFFRKGMVNSL